MSKNVPNIWFFSQNGLTPLHVAAHYDNQEVALLLLEKEASPHATAKVRQSTFPVNDTDTIIIQLFRSFQNWCSIKQIYSKKRVSSKVRTAAKTTEIFSHKSA